MKSRILIEGIECYAYHGCLTEETQIGSNFSVDVIIETDLQKAAVSDELQDTVDYVLVHNVVREEMKIPSRIIEHAAGRILIRLSKETGASNIIVRLTKFNPPVNGLISKATVELTLK